MTGSSDLLLGGVDVIGALVANAVAFLGVLAASAIGAGCALWGQRYFLSRTQSSEDTRRFHVLRVEYYATFSALTSQHFAAYAVGIEPGADEQRAFMRAYERVRMVASTPVFKEVTKVHTYMCLEGAPKTSPPDQVAFLLESAKHSGAMVMIMREELNLRDDTEQAALTEAAQEIVDGLGLAANGAEQGGT